MGERTGRGIGALAAPALVAGALAVLVSAAGAVLGHRDVLPVPLVQILLPSALPAGTWFGAAPGDVLVPAASGLLTAALVAVAVLLVRRSAGGARAPFAVWWLAVALAGTAAGLGSGLGAIAGDWPPLRLRMLLDPLPPFLRGAALWGVVWGWVPALVARRLHPAPGRAAPVALPLAALALAAALAAPLVPAAPAAVRAAPSPPATRDGPAVPAVAPGHHAVPAAWCSDDQVEVGLERGDAALGHRMSVLTVTNRTGVDCTVRGYPDLVFADATDALLPVHVLPGGSVLTKDRGPAAVLLRPGQRAVSEIGWDAQASDPAGTARTVHLAAYPGALRTALPFTGDVVRGCSVAVTAWHPAAATG